MDHLEHEPNPFSNEPDAPYTLPASTPVDEGASDDNEDLESSHSTLNHRNHSSNGQTPAFSPPSTSPNEPSRPIEYKNEIDRYIHSGDDVEIQISDALKTSEGTSSPYIVYVIKTGNVETRRRYSDFESFRNGLIKLYPTLIIPPIPDKQTLSDYAVKQSKAKEDTTLIARRKRMLQVFLNRIGRHAILSTEVVFHRFLSADVSWSEVLHSPPLSQLPKNILKAPAHNPLDDSMAIAYAALPSPSPSAALRNPDQRFQDSENFTNRFANHLSGSMEKVTRRTMKRWSEYASDHAELGAVLNGFSLSETGHLASAVEKTGQAIDATYISTARLLQDLEQSWTEPLHEYSQFADAIKKLLQYRHQKHVQYEMTIDNLESKRESLEELEKNEAEARRLEEALVAAGVRRTSPANQPSTADSMASSVVSEGGKTATDGEEGTEDESDREESDRAAFMSASVPPPPSSTSSSRRSKGGGLLSALSHSIHGMMDVDPESARRSAISKTRDSISQLEDAQHVAVQDLKYASSTIQADLDRFQRQKVADLRDMALAMARIHRDWCKANLEAWEAAKAEIAAIEPHPNSPPSTTS